MRWVEFLSIGVAGLLVSCTLLPSINRSSALPSVQTEMSVKPGSEPGRYEASGKTAFPDRTALRVAAIRYLYPNAQRSKAQESRPTYSILAYNDSAIVENGTWNVSLSLWQTAPDGQPLETWQITQAPLNLQVKPDPAVVFIATLAPGIKVDALQSLEQQLLSKNQALDPSVVSRTVNGDRFLQVMQTVDAALPTRKQDPTSVISDDLNGGWGNRFLMPDEPPNPNNLEFPANRRTNAAPREREYLR